MSGLALAGATIYIAFLFVAPIILAILLDEYSGTEYLSERQYFVLIFAVSVLSSYLAVSNIFDIARSFCSC